MTKEEAKKYLIDISYALGNMSIEYLTEKDGEKMREAIETLWQEPCSDAISRRAVLEYIEASEAELGHSTENELVCQHIKEFPPVVPQPNMWIPVSNKPKEEGSYMTTLDYGDYGLAVGQRFYYGDYGWTDGHVIAWMALPEPYKPQESEVEA